MNEVPWSESLLDQLHAIRQCYGNRANLAAYGLDESGVVLWSNRANAVSQVIREALDTRTADLMAQFESLQKDET